MEPTQGLTTEEVQRWCRIGVLSALAMLLGYAETFIPVPIPGVKLGLANVATLAALAEDDVAGAFCISCIKALAAGLLFGSPLTIAFSAVGTLLSFVGMALLSRLKTMHLVMVSIVGALLHEIGQLVVASVLLGTNAVWYSAPVLLVAGCITGALCGMIASRLNASLCADSESPSAPPESHVSPPSTSASLPATLSSPHAGSVHGGITSHILTVLAIGSIVVVLHIQSIAVLALFALVSLAACLAARANPRVLVRSIRPLAAIALFTFVMQLVLSPQNAPQETARALLRLVSTSALCVLIAALVPVENTLDVIKRLVSPLERMGIRTAGFFLACEVALRLVPTMGSILELNVLRLRDVPDLIPKAYHRLAEEARANMDHIQS